MPADTAALQAIRNDGIRAKCAAAPFAVYYELFLYQLSEKGTMKRCQYCAEEIQDQAIKCKHCKEWLNQPPANQIDDFGDFMDVEGARVNHIADQFRPQIEEALRVRGFQDVRLTGDSLAHAWRLEMAQLRPLLDSDGVERILTNIVAQLRYREEQFKIKDGLAATVSLEGHIKSAFFLSERS